MKLLWVITVFFLFSTCSTDKALSFECNDIMKCEGTVDYENTNPGIKEYHFVMDKKEDISKFCKLLQQSNKISQGPNPPLNSTVNIAIFF
jgi:hypothetical protein